MSPIFEIECTYQVRGKKEKDKFFIQALNENLANKILERVLHELHPALTSFGIHSISAVTKKTEQKIRKFQKTFNFLIFNN